MMRNKNKWILSLGIFLISISVIIEHFFQGNDFMYGLGIGGGIGLLLIGLSFNQKNSR